MKINVTGSTAYDRILYFDGSFKDHFLPDKIHALSVSFPIETIEESFGGAGANIAYNLKLLGIDPILYSVVGGDGNRYLEYFSRIKISREHVIPLPEKLTPQAHIMSDRDNNQITGFHQGAGSDIYPGEFPVGSDSITIIAPSYAKEMLAFAEHCKANDMRYIFDPGQQTPTFTPEEYRTCVGNAWIFVANDYEMALSLAKLGWTEEELYQRVPVVITTLGEEGSRIHTEGSVIEVDKVPADVVTDPTGAGDAYRAGLIKGLAMDLSIRECAQLASAAASYAIETQGTQNHTFSLADIKALY
ncbi:MAG: carbohydrate kinase family protein [Patescibacteria group bacterium]